MKLSLTDLKAQYLTIKKEIDEAIQRVLNDGRFIFGPDVELLEQEIATCCGVKHGIGVASGTDALILALIANGIKPGDGVITTPLTFVATGEAIVRAGGIPVFVDIDEKTCNIDPSKIEQCLKSSIVHRPSSIKAIVPVHLYGQCCDMDKILGIAQKYNLKVIEDCAQAIGAEYLTKIRNPIWQYCQTEIGNKEWRKAGSMGEAGCFSFFPAKTLGCYGDGGMIITNNPKIAEKIRVLRNHGCKKKNFQETQGFNSRLDTIQAAILRVKLRHLTQWIEKRRKNAQLYCQFLSEIKEVEPPYIAPYARHSFNYFTIRIRQGKQVRDKLQRYLLEQGISTNIYYPLSLHLQKVYKHLGYKKGDLPVSEKVQEENLGLPMFPELREDQIELVTRAIKNFFL